MHPAYRLADVADVFSPALVLYPELIRQNIARVVELAGAAKATPVFVLYAIPGRDRSGPPATPTAPAPRRPSTRPSPRPWAATTRST